MFGDKHTNAINLPNGTQKSPRLLGKPICTIPKNSKNVVKHISAKHVTLSYKVIENQIKFELF